MSRTVADSADATQTLISEVQKDLRSVYEREQDMKIDVSAKLNEHAELNAELARRVSARMNELQEEIRAGQMAQSQAAEIQQETLRDKERQLHVSKQFEGVDDEVKALQQ